MPKILTLADICYSWAADLYRPSCKFLSRGKLERKPPSKTSASATQDIFFKPSNRHFIMVLVYH